ncbi:MAG: rod shape-determining protein MreC [Verrucomicrobiota bacterium]
MVWLVLGAVLVVILNLPNSVSRRVKASIREVISPLQEGITDTGRTLKEAWMIARGLGGLAIKNREMEEELIQLRNEALYLRALERENVALREQLRFMQKSSQTLVPCEFVARDISGWWQTVRLSRGSADGVAVNRAVVTPEGVIGKTIDVSRNTCDVLLVSDPGCKISAKISRSETFGVVSGQGVTVNEQVVMKMDFINKKSSVNLGDEVVTSGLGGVFPKGLFIGYVDKIYTSKNGLYLSADIVPREDVGTVNYAFVVAEDDDPIEELLRRKEREAEQLKVEEVEVEVDVDEEPVEVEE